MGNSLTRIQKDGYINWQHRALVANDPAATSAGAWISYTAAVTGELEEAVKDEQAEPVYSIQNSSVYQNDQILFNGDLAARLGGPFVHRSSQDKSLKELRRVASGFYLHGKGDFSLFSQGLPTQVPEKATMLNSASCTRIFQQLYILANRDFTVESNADPNQTFVAVSEAVAAKLSSTGHTNAQKGFFQMNVADDKNVKFSIIVQQFDLDFLAVENAIPHDLKGTDSKVAAVLCEEARMSFIVDMMSRLLLTPEGQAYRRFDVEVDSTTSRKSK